MRLNKKRGFTLIELLVVITIIVILIGLILTLLPFIHTKEARARAEGEMAGIKVALDAYKADNGSYPDDAIITAGGYQPNYTDSLDARTANDPTQSAYTNAGLVLYRALTGDRNLDRTTTAADMNYDLDGNSATTALAAPPQNYFQSNNVSNMLLPSGGTGTVTNFVDPFGYNYGYSTAYAGDVAVNNANGTNTPPANGYNPTYDLWSTGGTVTTGTAGVQTNRAKWLINWQNSGANAGQ